MPRLLHDLAAILRAWWRADRPRASPREGRLLRIRPPAIVRVGTRLIEVVSRTVGEDRHGPYVLYRCRCGHKTSELRVGTQGCGREPTAHWVDGGRDIVVPEGEIEVYPYRL